ncbi:LysR family transcriptional regulator [Alteromonadaceae bacterium BrNp21-10]|nr:LysR family transcriptional regulator [Alteromonadaceae bacterium BrNp21-10]
MNWNALKLFLAIAQSKSLTGAALVLGLNHSTVYRQLNDFEEQVGRVFERLNGSYELTELGEEILVQAQHVSHLFDDIERHIAGKDTQPKGVVRITAPSSFSYSCLPDHIAALNELYPDIQIELLVTNLELNMTNRHADIAIRVTSAPPDHLVGRQVRLIKWGVYASEEYISKQGRAEGLNDFSQHRLIGATGVLRNHPVFSWLDNKVELNIGQRTDDLVAMACLAHSGQGIALLPDDLAKPGLVRLFTFSPQKENQLWILTHADLRNVERIKIVMKYLATALTEPNTY